MDKVICNACSSRKEGEERNCIDSLTAARSRKNQLVENPAPVIWGSSWGCSLTPAVNLSQGEIISVSTFLGRYGKYLIVGVQSVVNRRISEVCYWPRWNFQMNITGVVKLLEQIFRAWPLDIILVNPIICFLFITYRSVADPAPPLSIPATFNQPVCSSLFQLYWFLEQISWEPEKGSIDCSPLVLWLMLSFTLHDKVIDVLS